MPLVLPEENVNPFNDENLKFKEPKLEGSEKEEVEEVARKLESLLKERKCKLEGICEVRNELYIETFNELIR